MAIQDSPLAETPNKRRLTMLKDMLGSIVRELVQLPKETLVVLYDLLVRLSDPEWVEYLKKFNRKENPWAVPVFPIWKTINGLDLILVSLADLGFKNGTTYLKFYRKAEKYGLGFCSAKFAKKVRKEYQNQKKHEWLRVIMDTNTNRPDIMALLHDENGLDLRKDDIKIDQNLPFELRFIFIQRK